MKHYLINVTWRCHNNCRYCWMQRTVKQRPALYDAPERPLEDWVAAINRDSPDIVDIAGGEPLLVGWIPELIRACPEVRFGLSTNGLELDEVLRLADNARFLSNLISINVSYHPDALARWQGYELRWKKAVTALRAAGFPVSSNLIDYEDHVARCGHIPAWLRSVGVHSVVSPYEIMEDLGEKLAQGLCCQGGINHLTVAPDGAAWPCLTTIRSPYWQETSLGNWLDGAVDLARKAQPCYLNCVDYYVLPQQHQSGDMWQIHARPAKEGEPC